MEYDSMNERKKKKQGPVIPAGTEQETGLTRGLTEKKAHRKALAKNIKKGGKNAPVV
jgi:hypothetical protein